MNLSESVKRVLYSAEELINKKTPELLAATGVCCFIISTIEAVKATPKAVKLLEDKKEEVSEELTLKEKVKTAGKVYVKSALYGAAGVIFVGASVSESNKRYFALTTSYKLIEETARTYKEKVIETIGEKKEKAIRDSIAQDDVDNNPPVENKIIITNSGNTLFKESLTGQYFRSDINEVKKKGIDLSNKELTSYDNYVSVHEWLLELGNGEIELPSSFKNHGWSLIEQGRAVTVDLSAAIAHKFNDEPCLVINYSLPPISDVELYYR